MVGTETRTVLISLISRQARISGKRHEWLWACSSWIKENCQNVDIYRQLSATPASGRASVQCSGSPYFDMQGNASGNTLR